jgi:DNA-binding NtrC family response regulator
VSERARILVVEDDTEMAALLRDDLSSVGHDVTLAASASAAARALADPDAAFDLMVTDVRLGVQDGLDLLEELRRTSREEGRPTPHIIVITAFGSLETAVRAFRAGATDFLTKPFEMQQLQLAVRRALDSRRMQGEIRRLREETGFPTAGGIVAVSPSMRSVVDTVDRVADSDATVLITGPSGTGKELVAKALHERSRRVDRPFIAINCSALPEQLLESELFGYRRGAFTGARVNKEGLFQAAAGGTLFLDELGELPLTLQPKLLRVLQEREITPLGATRPEAVDVRIVGATNQLLEKAVEEKRFREDLYYRLNVIRIEMTPLADRREDILPLADAYLARYARRRGQTFTLTAAASEALQNHAWPGNVRELNNALERAVTLVRTPTIDVTDLPSSILRPPTSQLIDSALQRRLTAEQLLNEYCQAVVRQNAGNQTAAARFLDIDRKTLARRLAPPGSAEAEGLDP